MLLGDGLLGDLGKIVTERIPAHRYAVISDSNVAPRYGDLIQQQLGRTHNCSLFEFPAGEQNKTRKTWATLTDDMLSAGFGRDCAVVALGGGVVGDMAGFVASTFLRGVPYIQIPTSLLAMIDSSVGGKTGVDTRHGKNLVGTFCQPTLVVADVSTLATLPPRHVSAGAAEAIKHGAISDTAYFGWLSGNSERVLALDADALTQLVHRSVQIKSSVVAKDERELGLRAILNFGHTIAHALEAESCFELIHGEAVSIGMVAEGELGVRAGLTDATAVPAIRNALAAFGLPTCMPSAVDVDNVMAMLATDKKVRSGTVRFALIERIGCAAQNANGTWTHSVAGSAIREVIDVMG